MIDDFGIVSITDWIFECDEKYSTQIESKRKELVILALDFKRSLKTWFIKDTQELCHRLYNSHKNRYDLNNSTPNIEKLVR